MKTNVSKRDAIEQAMDWLGQLREEGRAEATLSSSGEPAAAPAVTAPPAPVAFSPAPVAAPLEPLPAPPVPAAAPLEALPAPPVPAAAPLEALPAPPVPVAAPLEPLPPPPMPRVSDEDDPREGAAITERAPIGDELRIPIAWCDMDACISYYEHPAALGEADIRARAIAAGWRVDAVGRLACPQCQQSVPWFWTTQPVVVWDRGRAVTAAARMAATVRAEATGSAGGEAEPGTIPAVELAPAPWSAEGGEPEGSRGSDQGPGGRPDRA